MYVYMYVYIYICMTYDELWWCIYFLQASGTNQSGKSWKISHAFWLNMCHTVCFPKLCVGHPQLSCKSLECQDVCIYMYYIIRIYLHIYQYAQLWRTIRSVRIRIRHHNTVSDVVGRGYTGLLPSWTRRDAGFVLSTCRCRIWCNIMLTGRCHWRT